MNTLKAIWLNLVNAFGGRRPPRPPSPKEIEAERIDRIRFPSKYLGK
jgi:hypothetical protein